MGTPFSKIGGNPIVLGLDGLKDEVKAGLNTPADIPTLAVGSAAALLGDVETATWMERTTTADGAALIESVKGNTLRWNQLIRPNPRSVTSRGVTYTNTSDGKVTLDGTATGAESFTSSLPFSVVSGHKYVCRGTNLARTVLVSVTGIGGNLNSDSIYTATSDIASTTLSVTIGSTYTGTYECYPQLFDLTQMFGSGNEPATVAEFEALFPKPYYTYDAGSLLPVRMEGVETCGRNLLSTEGMASSGTTNGITFTNRGDGSFEAHGTASANTSFVLADNDDIRRVISLGGEFYFQMFGATHDNTTFNVAIRYTEPGSSTYKYINAGSYKHVTVPAGSTFNRLVLYVTSGTMLAANNDVRLMLEYGSTGSTYEPYWSSQRAIPASTYFPDGMRSAGTVRDELTETAAITRVGSVDLGTLTWVLHSSGTYFYTTGLSALKAAGNFNLLCSAYQTTESVSVSGMADKEIKGNASSGDVYVKDSAYTTAADLKAALSGVMLYYELATPTTTPIDPPLPMSYRVGAGGTERVMFASGTTSAPPVFATRYPLDPTDLAASIAPRESAVAEANHQVGDLIMLGWTLCKATQVIVTGETIEIGTNVTRTSVAAELAALSE